MKIYCTKEEFRKMSANCSNSAYCNGCILAEICNDNKFIDFIEDVDCSNNESKEVHDNAEISEH